MPTVDDPVPGLIRALRSATPDARCRAAKALGKLGWLAREALPLLVHCLRESDAPLREAAAQAVGQMGPDAIPYLTSMLTHPDKYVRRNAVWALGKLGPLGKVAVPALCAALKDGDPRTASGAAQALGAMGPDAAEAVPALTEAMRGTNIVLCRLASKALSQVGRAALPALLEHLRHRDPFVRGEAALALGWLGPAAAAAVPALSDILRPEQFPAAGKRIDHYAATPPMLVTPPPAPTADETCQAQAAQALGRIGPAAESALPVLLKLATCGNELVRQSAEQAARLVRG